MPILLYATTQRKRTAKLAARKTYFRRGHLSADSAPDQIINFLRSDAAQGELARLATLPLRDEESLAVITSLRRTFSPDEAALLLQQARLRKRATAKFPNAAHMYFVEEALEQATSHAIATERARLLSQHAPVGDWLDLGCGIGGDLLALAQRRAIMGYELDPLRAAIARANIEMASPPHAVEIREEDWVAALDGGGLPQAAAAFVDPARRVQSGAGRVDTGRRVFSLHTMQPSIDAVLRLAERVPLVAVKVMPGVQDAEIPAAASVQFMSHEGICKEAVLWFGLWGGARRWASVHDGAQWHEIESSGAPPPQGDLAAGLTLYEPDPAVIRAGALAELCTTLNGWQFDPQIAYLISNSVATIATTTGTAPFVTPFYIRELHRFSVRLLNERIAALKIGAIELKKRGFPTEPESLRPKLKLVPGGGMTTVIFTRHGSDHLMLICERYSG